MKLLARRLGINSSRSRPWTTASWHAKNSNPSSGHSLACSRSCKLNTSSSKTRTYSTVSAAELTFGQPTHETHPHLLGPGETTPGITAQEYYQRRARLAHLLEPDTIAVLASADIAYRSGAVFYPFRQESNFLYLTGFNEPESLAIIRKTGPNLGDYEFTLFARPKDPQKEQWHGPWSGLQAAQDVWNADEALSIYNLDKELPKILKGVKECNVVDSKLFQSQRWGDLLRYSRVQQRTSLSQRIHELRAIKSDAEIACMRKAGQISGRAITDAMRRPWSTESHLAAFLNQGFVSGGCDGEAYVPVVAGGPRSHLIHYTQNNAQLRDGELVVVDAGGEYGTYITDITRTWPTGPGAKSGKFTPAQRDLYEAVLRVQRTGVSLCRASAALSLDQIHAATQNALTRELQSIGFEMGRGDLNILFPHHVGHYVGLDVHDVPDYSRHNKLVKGHCVTIEPGVYVPDDERFPVAFRGMGVRIEDSVCVGENDPYVLTTEAVKEVVDIEALREA